MSLAVLTLLGPLWQGGGVLTGIRSAGLVAGCCSRRPSLFTLSATAARHSAWIDVLVAAAAAAGLMTSLATVVKVAERPRRL